MCRGVIRLYTACAVNITEVELAMILHLIYNKANMQIRIWGQKKQENESRFFFFFLALVIILTVQD